MVNYHTCKQDLTLKARDDGTPCLPAIVKIDNGDMGHVVLLLPSGKKLQPYSYSQLMAALMRKDDPSF